MRRARRPLLALAAIATLAVGGTLIAHAAPGDLTLVCPAVQNPVAGQQITCTYVAEPTPTVPPTTTAPTTTTPPVTTTTNPPVGRSCPALPAFPTPSCTGTPAGLTLADVNGDVSAPAGTVIDGKRITGKVTVTGNGVVIKNSDIHGGVTNGAGHWSFTITDSTLGAPTGCNGDAALQYDRYTATRVLVRNFGDAFRSTSNPITNRAAVNSLASGILIQDSYVKLCSNPGDHGDGFQGFYGGTGVQFLHNTIDQRGAPDATAPLFNSDYSKGVVARDNLLAGGSFTIRLDDDGTGDPASKSTATGNRVVANAWQYGPVHSDCASITWSGNSVVDIDTNYTVTNTVGELLCS